MIYFDNAATTYPKPVAVRNAVVNAMTDYGANPGRSGHDMAIKTAEKVYDCRKALADLFNSSEENVAFTSNCTGALNAALKGVLREGDHIIISDLEHNSILRPIHALAKQGFITYSIATVYEEDFEKTLESFKNAITEETRMIACTNGSNLSGVILPIKEIGQLCKEKGILFLVDAAQSAGTVNIDTKSNNIDFLCMPGHKGLYGPSGTGALITAKGDLITPLIEGGTGSMSLIYDQPNFMPDKLESGTINTTGIIGLLAGVEFVNKRGLDNIYKHEINLAEELYYELSKISNVKLYTKKPKIGTHLPVVPFNIENLTSEAVTEELNKSGFALRGGFHCAPLTHKKLGTTKIGAVRASFSVFNTETEVQVFIKAVEKLARHAL